MMSLEFVIEIKFFRSHYGSGVGSASNRNEYQVCFFGGKCGRCVRLTIHHPVPLSWDLETLTSWKPLDHSRPVTRLLYLYVTVYIQLSCVPNRQCCFTNFGIQRHFVWSIEHGLSSSSGVTRNFLREGSTNSFEEIGQTFTFTFILYALLRKMQFLFCICSTWT